ncbi:MliC family protein [Vreelandella salicampi]|uniref:MliC family protein n=1 Tax=Vreelandella salicampi TaxID=1449798 RepID=A0A7Z0LKE5_9GAMM|nr:MliC family protein [Halomonas salicampi]NYS60601.1 MliC family protein [Halomonas salicampi]
MRHLLTRNLLALSLALLLVSGCATTSAPIEPSEQRASEGKATAPLLPSALFAGGADKFEAWRCEPASQHLVTAFNDETLRLWSLHGAWQLPQAVVASGARYQNGKISFWNRGDKAQVETPRGQLQCQQAITRETLTREAHPGVMFLGRGNEPGWSVALSSRTPTLTLTTDYGEKTQQLPYMMSVMDNDAGRVVLENANAGRFFRVRIEASACFDDMSGHPYPARVTLSIDGQQYSGCGQGIAP